MHKPAHLSGTAGQIVNRDIGDTEEMLYSKKAVYTIGDYIKQAQEQEESIKKKLTFEEWIKISQLSLEYSMDDWDSLSADFEKVWKAAQENV